MRKDDLRSGKPDWQSEPRELVASWVHDELAPIAKSLGITVGQLSIAWAVTNLVAKSSMMLLVMSCSSFSIARLSSVVCDCTADARRCFVVLMHRMLQNHS
jgi:aryl-alcohol dehydrogenase-like predicted oxidoreductase